MCHLVEDQEHFHDDMKCYCLVAWIVVTIEQNVSLKCLTNCSCVKDVYANKSELIFLIILKMELLARRLLL